MFKKTILAVFPFFFLMACSVNEPDSVTSTEPVKSSSPFLSGYVSVQFDEETAELVEASLADGDACATKALGDDWAALGIKSLRRVFPHAGEFEPRTRREGLHRFYFVEFDKDTPATKAALDLSSIPGVVHVTPQLPVEPRAIWNDPYFGMQWHMVNGRYAGADINVEKVWKEFTVGSPNVIVSVVDAGVNMDHEDLAGNVIPCYPDGSGSFNFNNNTPNVVPSESHGTHVAGIVAAVSNNGIGVAGVAGGNAAEGKPGVKIMSCQIMDLYGNTPDYYQALKHGADHGAVILQCSWGFSPDLDHDGIKTDEEIALYRTYTIDDLPEFKAAIDYFIKYAGCDNDGNQLPDAPMKGGIAVFAAGNDTFDYDPLVSYDPIIAVASFDMTGKRSSFTNYGDWVDLAAPGGEINSAIYSTIGTEGSGSYGGKDFIGTSMACPHVSGVAALLVSYFGGPGFTAEECRTRLVRGGVSNAFPGPRYIGRKLDAYGAFTFDPNTPILPPVLSWETTPPQELNYNQVVDLTVKATDPNGQHVNLKVTSGNADIEDNQLHIDARVLGPGKHSIRIVGENEDHATASLELNVKVLSNHRPQHPDTFQGVVLEGEGEQTTLNLSDIFQDTDNDPLTYQATLSPAALASVTVTGEGQLLVKALQSGVGELRLEASDGKLTSFITCPLVVKRTDSPVYVYPSSATTAVNAVIDAEEPVQVQLAVYSVSGEKALEKQLEADCFHPITVNIKALAPGMYTLKASYSGKTHSVPFYKR